MAITGGCLCGAVRFTIEADEPLGVRQCWCRVCQYLGAGSGTVNAIFPKGAAKFVSASSYGPALVALGASVNITGPSGSRKVNVADFFLAPSSGDQREIDLKPNEILS